MDLPLPKQDSTSVMAALFAEELGLVLEVDQANEGAVLAGYRDAGVHVARIGHVTSQPQCDVLVGGEFAVAGRFKVMMFMFRCTAQPTMLFIGLLSISWKIVLACVRCSSCSLLSPTW